MPTAAPQSPLWDKNGRNPTSRQWSAFGGKAEVSYQWLNVCNEPKEDFLIPRGRFKAGSRNSPNFLLFARFRSSGARVFPA